MNYFSGPARVFEGEEAMLSALLEDPQSFKVNKIKNFCFFNQKSHEGWFIT